MNYMWPCLLSIFQCQPNCFGSRRATYQEIDAASSTMLKPRVLNWNGRSISRSAIVEIKGPKLMNPVDV